MLASEDTPKQVPHDVGVLVLAGTVVGHLVVGQIAHFWGVLLVVHLLCEIDAIVLNITMMAARIMATDVFRFFCLVADVLIEGPFLADTTQAFRRNVVQLGFSSHLLAASLILCCYFWHDFSSQPTKRNQ